MNLFARWCRFNAVGAMGMVVQLAALAALNRWTGGHYLIATLAALELTLVHNFLWHLHYTWRDRRDDSAVKAQLLKFHLSNGMISLVGNLALMRLLVSSARMPVLVADTIAILVCSLVNFGLGHTWAFAARD
ncbi:MAG: GtrA family protein [Acidobacteriaceae bacterium]|jgi:putative flippase GtrA